MDDFGIRLDQLNEGRSKLSVPSRKLDSQGGEDKFEAPPVLEVSGAKERGTQPPICEHPLCDRLCDGALACPSKPVQPIDRGFVGVTGPEFDLVKDGCARTPKTTISIAMLISGLLRAPYVIEDSGFGCKREFFFLGDHHRKREDGGHLTWVLERGVTSCVQMQMETLTICLNP